MRAEYCLKPPRRFAQIGAVTALLAFSFGCDDPSSAGLELVDDDGARPVTMVQAATLAEEGDLRDETGGSDRVLSGTVNDPVSGTVSAVAYLDFSEPLTPTSAFRAGPVDSVTLILTRDYLYGDSLLGGTLLIHDMDDEWPSAAVPADSVLTAGTLVTSVAYSPTDATIKVPLPASWLTANEESVRIAGSDTLFHGFQISIEGANAVVGFDVTSSALRVVSGGDALEFPVTRRLSTASRLSPTAAPTDRLLLQDTVGPAIKLDFDLADDDLAAAIVNYGAIRVTVDTVAFANNQPANFARPAPTRLELQALTNVGALLVLETSLVVDGVATFSSGLVRAALQGLARDLGTVENFRIGVDVDENGIGSVMINGLTVDGEPNVEIIYSKLK